jgi:protein-S-isoprenylcysteine O-methyltransferase Ste14
MLVLFGALLFGSAGRLDWANGWAFLGAFVAFSAVGHAILDPALIAERSKLGRGGTRPDLLLATTAVVLLYPATFVTAGLDTRYGWSPPLPVALQATGLSVFLAGYGVALWAMHENVFFATVVRVQSERGHRVIDTGPYGIVRHPGYAGSIAAHLALPLALGSLAALVPTVLGCLLVARRTIPEERTLERELPGYPEYERRVRRRLVPGVW